MFLIGGIPPWKLKILPVVDDGVLLNKPPVFGCVEVAPLLPNNPVVVVLLLVNNPLPVLLANKLPVVLENNPLPLTGVVLIDDGPLLVNNPENKLAGLVVSAFVSSTLVAPFSPYFFTVTILQYINNI